ncbi:phage holin family protein [Paenibacillus campi]|uniref:phage holin family protein n=1 Tax=Paenibacillus campi TaxID=3106031 RepID=UPI002B000F9D|nr:phage holin family protein [Paenibacillus sp. SGZ-1014]
MPEIIKIVATATGAIVGYAFGGWSVLIHLLLVLVIVDWLSGWAAAWMRGELKSRKGFHGATRKVAIFAIVTIAHFIDTALNLSVFQDAVVFFYLANELLSVIENMGKMGLPMPDVLRNAVHIFESKRKPPENPVLIPEAQPEAVKEEKLEEDEKVGNEQI